MQLSPGRRRDPNCRGSRRCDVGEGLEGGGLIEMLEFEPSAGGDDEGLLVEMASQGRAGWGM